MAAEQLGISRRTLSRKLKQYNLNQREDDGSPLGVLNRDQHQYFRAAIELPITIVNTRGEKIQARTINISSGGMCIDGLDNPLQCSGTLDIRFPMPETGILIEAKAQVAWADVHKKAGLRFTEFPVDAKITLDRWLNAKQHEEGWTVAV
jgi:c-di-GMP-binding flagellar brake protein YcgR